ncbi:MAG: restriction endonuclease subunit S [Thermoguttaceae bacterium]|nr:restriction endonuclease subunit S [Thermoguttaceae bacterium]
MKLDLENWKRFTLGRLFNIKKGKRLTAEDQEDGNIPYIGAIDSNNGVSNHIAQKPIHDGNTISLSYNGSVGEAFYQPKPYWATDDVNALYSTFDGFNESIGLFMAATIRKEKYRFSYGRKWTLNNMRITEICLPIQHNADGTPIIDTSHKYSDDGYVPDWQFMENYIKSLHHKPLTTKIKSGHAPDLHVKDWKEFTLNDVFKLRGGFYNKKPEHSTEGNIPFLASTESNNGVTEFYSIEDIKQWDKVGGEDWTLAKKMYDGNCIAVTVNGSVCNAFYQPEQFTCSHDITAFYLRHHEMNPYIASFLCTIIMKDKYRWSYGRKPHDVKKFGKSIIKLPVDSSGNPDWQFMEDYIKALPYGDRLEG